MSDALNVAQILVSIILILVVLMQVRETGTGLFGSGQASYRTRRGVEKTLFQFTILLAVVFLLMSIVSVRYT